MALGYLGSERTTRRAVAAAKKAYRAGRRRIYRPWVPEPGRYAGSGGPILRSQRVRHSTSGFERERAREQQGRCLQKQQDG